MKSRDMKSLVAVLMLAGALGLSAGCTPSESFCPNVGADAGGVCPIFGDDGMAPVDDMGTSGGLCPDGYQVVIDSTKDAGYRCVLKT
jgi:hypothetical protein